MNVHLHCSNYHPDVPFFVEFIQILNQIQNYGKLSDIAEEWQKQKLNSSLKKACMLGNYKMAIMIIRAGANNFEQCIKECAQQNRLNHILAYLRLCQAAYEDDQTAVDILLECNEDKISDHPHFSSLMDFNQILLPLIDNGTLAVTEPFHVALRANHSTTAGKILLQSSKRSYSGMVDWHGLEITELKSDWLKSWKHSNLQLLCLSFNLLKRIPTQIADFSSLVKLQVAFNNLTDVLPDIFQMPCIENVDLSYNSISALPDMMPGKVSMSLHILTLSSNVLSKFPDYFTESAISVLDLSKNRFKEVPQSVCSMKQLESLNMSHNAEIRFIPYELGGLKHLKVTSFDGLPYTLNVPNDSLMNFIKKRFKSMQTVSHYEVVILSHPLSSEVSEKVHTSLVKSGLDCSVLKFDSPTHFLNLHHIFQLPNAMYLLPWDCQNQQDPNDLHRVLRHLSIHAPSSPTIIAACWNVFNAQLEMKLEELIATSLWRDLRENIHLEHIQLEEKEDSSPTPAYSLQSLISTISTLSEDKKLTQFVPWSYYDCGGMLTKLQEKYRSEIRSPMLSEDDFWEAVSSMPSHDLSSREELPKLVSYLNLIGLLMRIQGPAGSQSYYIFDRQWFCNLLGNVVLNRNAQVIHSFSGIVHQEVLIDLLGSPSLKLPLPDALRYTLNKEAIALPLSSEKWLIPPMLMESHDNTVDIDAEQYGIRRQYTFKLIPASFWCRLIAHLLMNMESFVREVSDSGCSSSGYDYKQYTTLPRQGVIDWSYWKKGILCWQNACHLVYSIEAIDVCSDPYQETIEVRVPNDAIGYRVMNRLSLVIDTLLRNWYPTIWNSVEIWVPCNYCIHSGFPDIPSISFHDCLLALTKGVGVKCLQHLEKVVSIAKIIPDLIQEEVSKDVFLPPGCVEFDESDKSTCISPPPTETVFKGTFNHNLVAVKSFPHRVLDRVASIIGKKEDPDKNNSLALLEMWSEFEILRHLQNGKSPFIVDVVGVSLSPMCLVFPFARWSSLEDVILSKDISIPRLVRMKMVYQLASALSVLQSRRIIHRNVSLGNILVFSLCADDYVNIKLGGFSSACYAIFQGTSVGQFGTYPAPEMLQSNEGEYDERVDIFAFAFVAYEMITRSRMHVSSSIPLLEEARPSLEPVQMRAPYLVSLIRKCWHPNRTKRPFASKVAQILKHPLNVLVCEGQLIHQQHEFFSASARFKRIQNQFHSDLFVSSGQLMGTRTSSLSHVPLPGLNFEVFKQLPSEFVICMGCIGSQLWVSFYGKKVRVYSALNLEFINEFCFNYHVVTIATSPTSVYLGLENGVLQVYDVEESVPTDPSHTKIVNAGEEFKCLEPLEDNLICATKNTIFCLHPDTLNEERRWDFDHKREIRCIVISRCYKTEDEEEVEGDDLMWVAFRRWEQLVVMNPWTGQRCYSIDCSVIVGRPALKVYVQSLRVVLDTIWVGLNTGHILVFASNRKEPRLLTHLKVHKEGVRQLLLLHPSYMGPTTVLSSSEINRSLRDPQSSLIADNLKPTFPDSVLVVSFGTGMDSPLCSGSLEEVGMELGSECNDDGLYAVILEGANVSRTNQVERNSGRLPSPYMEGYCEENIYDVPPDDINIYDTPKKFPSEDAPRHDTWTATSVTSPVYSNLKSKPHYDLTHGNGAAASFSLSVSGSDSGETPAVSNSPPPVPPRDMLPLPDSPETSKGSRSTPHGVNQSPNNHSSILPPSKGNDIRRFLAGNRSPGAAIRGTNTTFKATGKHTGEIVAEDNDDSDDDDYEYTYPYQDFPRAQSYTLPCLGSKPHSQNRRMTYDDYSRPDIEDSAEGYEPYVRMNTSFEVQGTNLRHTATKANKKAKAIRQSRLKAELSDVPEEDFVSRDEFLQGTCSKIEEVLGLGPTKKVKPKTLPKPLKRYL